MSFNQALPLDTIQQVRLAVGDIDSDNPILPDEIYQHLLSKYSDNVKRASLDAARTILFYLPKFTRERAGGIEVYGGEWASNYRKALELFLRDPNISTIDAIPYAGGISKSDVVANYNDTDVKNTWPNSSLAESSDILNF